MTPFDAVVLAGGASRRMRQIPGPGSAIDKTRAIVGGHALLATAIIACRDAKSIVVVGPRADRVPAVTWTREDPVGGGPVAALAAGLALVSAQTVVVLAADLPFVTPETITTLLTALQGVGAAPVCAIGAVAIDHAGRDQPLLAAYDASALRAALPREPKGAALRSVLTTLGQRGTIVRVGLAAEPPAWWDCDTPTDLEKARMWT